MARKPLNAACAHSEHGPYVVIWSHICQYANPKLSADCYVKGYGLLLW